MAYFLKKHKQKNRTFLSIVESSYSHEKKGTVHKTYDSYGSIESNIAAGIEDPIAYYQALVDSLNAEYSLNRSIERQKQIGDSPERFLGYFLLKNMFDALHVKAQMAHLEKMRKFEFSIIDLLQALIYARVVSPCSKKKTLTDIIPRLYSSYSFSYDQILDGINFLGQEYEKIIEIFNVQIRRKYKSVNTDITYFDCTNFYFEIDKAFEDKQKGPSKEKKTDPIIGMGLLLDADQIPIGMKMYPGNQSEKPVLRQIVKDLKNRNNVTGRTIHVADKGLNCAKNIINAVSNKDGYIFSKSVKQLDKVEKKWVLNENGWTDIVDDEGKLIYRIKECIDEYEYEYKNDDGNRVTRKLTEKRIVSYNPKLAEKQTFEIEKIALKAKSKMAYQVKKDEYGEGAKYVNVESKDSDGKETKVIISFDEEKYQKDKELAGYNMIVTSEIKMSATQIYETYHNLWRIEESFRVMKSYLDARPVYLQKRESIYGHFLICYLDVLLLRLLQFKEFEKKYSSEQIIDFIKDYRVVKTKDNEYINITSTSKFIRDLRDNLQIPLTNYYLNDKQIKMMMDRCL